ncbi:Hsp20 family protein [Halonatronum saccharophilum]|uniref:Hsp20 family protein n=1 Tax=Halonatronum saccharophilum TaxID=150060 RepID=UPI00047F399A|nr:Hsp20 family protein [Halonatronum saccharophilum]
MFDLFPFRSGEKMENMSERFMDSLWSKSNILNNLMDLTNMSFKADIKEKKDAYILEAELAGLSKENINLDIDGDYLNIMINNINGIEEKNEAYIHKERKTGRYQRSFKLENVRRDQISAQYNNGLLIVHLPKEEVKTENRRSVTIQ